MSVEPAILMLSTLLLVSTGASAQSSQPITPPAVEAAKLKMQLGQAIFEAGLAEQSWAQCAQHVQEMEKRWQDWFAAWCGNRPGCESGR